MTSIGWFLVIACASSAAASSFLLRWSIDQAGGFTFQWLSLVRLLAQPWFVVGVALYGFAGLGWFRVIATEPLSTAYPILVSLTFMLVSTGAMLVFKEPLGGLKVLGLVLMVVGIGLVARG